MTSVRFAAKNNCTYIDLVYISISFSFPSYSTMEDDMELRKKWYWREALKKAGYPFVRKGTPSYETVMKIYDGLLTDSAEGASKCWKEACKYVTFGTKRIVKKDDPDYPHVRHVFNWMLRRVDEGKPYNDFKAYESEETAEIDTVEAETSPKSPAAASSVPLATAADEPSVKPPRPPTPPLVRTAFAHLSRQMEARNKKRQKLEKSVSS